MKEKILHKKIKIFFEISHSYKTFLNYDPENH